MWRTVSLNHQLDKLELEALIFLDRLNAPSHAINWQSSLQSAISTILCDNFFFLSIAHINLFFLQTCWRNSRSCMSKKIFYVCKCDVHVVTWYVANCLGVLRKRETILLYIKGFIGFLTPACRSSKPPATGEKQTLLHTYIIYKVLYKPGYCS